MRNQWIGLVSTIQTFKSTVKKELDTKNEKFHIDLNGEAPLSFVGLGPTSDERSPYLVEISDVLFWHDPTAYLDELERWEGQKVVTQHADMKRYIEESDQRSVFNRLVESIKRKRIAPFVGAGLSRPCGYPLWGEAIRKLIQKLEVTSTSEVRASQPALAYIDEAKERLENNDYLKAAQILYDNHKTSLERFVLDTFDIANGNGFHGSITLLPQLADGCIITTNFDNLIESVYQKCNRSIEGYMHGTQTQNQFPARLIQGERCILKLHGQHNSPETYIFSQSQYDDAYGQNKIDYQKPLAKVLRQIFISHSLLFLGCSLDQDRTMELFQDVVESKSFDIPEHFALLPAPNSPQKRNEKEDLLSKTKIRAIWYPVVIDEKGNQDHTHLESLIQLAVDCASGKARL